MHGAVGLPADAKNPTPPLSQSQSRHTQSVGQLRRRVTTKVAYTRGTFVNRIRQIGSTHLTILEGQGPIVPVLTKQAVERTGLVEHSQILVSVFRAVTIGELRVASSHAARTNPICHTIGGQRIVIPTDVGIIGGGTSELISFLPAQPAVTSNPGSKMAFVHTDLAPLPGCHFRGTDRKTERSPSFTVSLLYIRKHGSKLLPNTIKAYPERAGNNGRPPATMLTLGAQVENRLQPN
jgi:hypothetical protein